MSLEKLLVDLDDVKLEVVPVTGEKLVALNINAASDFLASVSLTRDEVMKLREALTVVLEGPVV